MNRILITVDSTGPAWNHVAGLARALAKREHEVRVVAFGPAPSPERRAELKDGVTLTHIALSGPTTDPAFVAAAREALSMVVQDFQPSVVQIDRCAFGDLDFGEIPKVLDVACDRTTRVARGRGPARKGLLGADAVVSPTRALADEISRRFEYRRPVSVIPPGIELGDAPVSVMAGRAKKHGIMYYGRIDEKADGFDMLIEAVKRLGLPEMPRVTIGGEGARNPLPGWISDAGWLDADGRAHAFAKAEIAMLPAREEPFGLLAAEAALSGCALLLSDVPTHHELWSGAAMLVRADDPQAFADALRLLLTDEKKRSEVARLCRARALSGFSSDRMLDEYMDVYRRIKRARSKRAGGPPRLSEDVLPLG
jgi:glycosyltransferase involved in cell wall biosynthesis